MGLGEAAIAAYDWNSYEVSGHSGEQVAVSLNRFINSRDSSHSRVLWWDIENVVFAQNTIYGVAAPTMEVLLAALADDRPMHVRNWIVELLRFLLSGGSSTDPDLVRRCHRRAVMGLWLLAREAQTQRTEERAAVLKVIALIDPDRAEQLKRWLECGASEP